MSKKESTSADLPTAVPRKGKTNNKETQPTVVDCESRVLLLLLLLLLLHLLHLIPYTISLAVTVLRGRVERERERERGRGGRDVSIFRV
jgi:hypothetical protein